ncbi:MAG TPA: response regulator, partial [Thermoanaerobaculia bacterium]|nr:response regulator [Thermoanaerobaculia bacterium]
MKTKLALLLVEDREDDALLVTEELRRAGFDLDWMRVESASETAHALKSRSWDVVISDFSLPAFSAPDALMVVRQHDPDLPFILCSGAVGEET